MNVNAQTPRDRRREISDLNGYYRLLRRNQVLVFGALLLTVLGTALVLVFSTPIYEASTSILIDTDDQRNRTLGLPTALQGRSGIHTEMEVLRSRTLAETVVDSLGLQLMVTRPRGVVRSTLISNIETSRTAPGGEYRLVRMEDGRFEIEDRQMNRRLGTAAPGDEVTLPGARFVLLPQAAEHDEIRLEVMSFNRAVKELRSNTVVDRPNPDANLVTVSYQGPDMELVRAVPDIFARNFIDRRLSVQKTEARSTVGFLRSQIQTLAVQLAAAEEELREFREGNHVVSLEAEARAQVNLLSNLQAERNLVDAERVALSELLASIRAAAAKAAPGEPSPYRLLVAFPTLFTNAMASRMMESLVELENDRAQLLNRRTVEDPDVQVLTARIEQIEQQLGALALTYLQGLGNQVSSYDKALTRFGDGLERIPAKEVEYARLQRRTNVLEQIYTLLQTRLKEAEIAEAVEDPSVRIVDPALLPDKPVRPRKMLNLALAAVFGMMLGVGAAFTRERLDNTIATRDDVVDLTGVPVLGVIPRIRGAAKGESLEMRVDGSRLVTGNDPHSPISEAYRSLRTNITFSRPDAAPKRLVLTSPTPGDGKTTTSSNLAVTLAMQGIRTILVDADMRRGGLNMVFGTPRSPGLSEVIMGTAHLDAAIRHVSVGEDQELAFLGTGTFPPNPAELLGSARMGDLLDTLEEHFDIVIIDSPPLNVVTDAAVIGRAADGVLLVVRAGKTQRDGIEFALEQLRNVRAPLLGTILNDASSARSGRYYDAYNYEYGPPTTRATVRPWPIRWIDRVPWIPSRR